MLAGKGLRQQHDPKDCTAVGDGKGCLRLPASSVGVLGGGSGALCRALHASTHVKKAKRTNPVLQRNHLYRIANTWQSCHLHYVLCCCFLMLPCMNKPCRVCDQWNKWHLAQRVCWDFIVTIMTSFMPRGSAVRLSYEGRRLIIRPSVRHSYFEAGGTQDCSSAKLASAGSCGHRGYHWDVLDICSLTWVMPL